MNEVPTRTLPNIIYDHVCESYGCVVVDPTKDWPTEDLLELYNAIVTDLIERGVYE